MLTVSYQSVFPEIQGNHDTTTGDEDCRLLIMATSTYGTLQEFKPECENISAYLEQVKAYFNANDVPSAKRVSVLLSVIGPSTYSILRSLMAPETPQTKSLTVIIKALKEH